MVKKLSKADRIKLEEYELELIKIDYETNINLYNMSYYTLAAILLAVILPLLIGQIGNLMQVKWLDLIGNFMQKPSDLIVKLTQVNPSDLLPVIVIIAFSVVLSIVKKQNDEEIKKFAEICANSHNRVVSRIKKIMEE